MTNCRPGRVTFYRPTLDMYASPTDKHSASPSFHSLVDVRHSDDRLTDYGIAVREYSRRKLTFDSDKLFAFAGLVRPFSWAWHTEMLYGLPTCCFDAALLWRSKDVRPESDDKTSSYGPPLFPVKVFLRGRGVDGKVQ